MHFAQSLLDGHSTVVGKFGRCACAADARPIRPVSKAAAIISFFMEFSFLLCGATVLVREVVSMELRHCQGL
jgi:hypothetical protein